MNSEAPSEVPDQLPKLPHQLPLEVARVSRGCKAVFTFWSL